MVTGLSQNEAQTSAGSTDEKMVMVNKLFTGAIVGILRAENIIRPDEGATHPAVIDAINKYDEYLGFDWRTEQSVPDAVMGFEHWLKSEGYIYTAPVLYTVSNMTITATMQTQSGQLSVAMQVYPADGVELSDVIRTAKGELQDAIGRAFSNNNNPSPLPETVSRTQESNVADVMALRVIKNEGRLEYRIIPRSGRWVKYGIPVYLDEAMKLGFNKYKEGDHAIGGTVTFTLKPDGKPQTVTEYFK